MVPFSTAQLLELFVEPAYPDVTCEESKIGWPVTKKHQLLHNTQLVELWWVRWPLEQTYYQTKRKLS